MARRASPSGEGRIGGCGSQCILADCPPGSGVRTARAANAGGAVQIPEITAEQLLGKYEALLLDAYGVLLHSMGPMPDAAAFVERLNQSGKSYYLLTNDA